MASTTATVLLAIRNDNTVRIGLPPKERLDNFHMRALECGKIDASYIFCSPDGDLYCIRGGDLYVGPMPSSSDQSWYSVASRVGRFEWGKFTHVLFSAKGTLYAVTKEGDMYMGPKPENENVSWMYDKADLIGRGGWKNYESMFFDPDGYLYAVTNKNELLKGPAPETSYYWQNEGQIKGSIIWGRYTKLMSITEDRKLWCIDKHNGNAYKWPVPKSDDDCFEYGEYLGSDYNQYKAICLTKDKTVNNIISFKFLPEKAKRLSETTIVIAESLYDNRGSSNTLSHTFEFDRKMKESSTFTHEHGMKFSASMEATFQAGIPYVAESEVKITASLSTSHNWKFTKTNETEITVSTKTDVEIEPGKAVKMKASIVSAELDVPYEAEVCTFFGSKTRIQGKWRGMSHFNLMVSQEDYTG